MPNNAEGPKELRFIFLSAIVSQENILTRHNLREEPIEVA